MLAPVDLFVRAIARTQGMTEAQRVALFLDLRERVLRHTARATRSGATGVPVLGVATPDDIAPLSEVRP